MCIGAHGVGVAGMHNIKASKGLRTVQYLKSTVIVFSTLRGHRVRAQIYEA